MSDPRHGQFRYELTYPLKMRWYINSYPMLQSIGKSVATYVRKRLKKGQGAEGALPAPKDVDTPPLNRSGQLIESVKFRKDYRASTSEVTAYTVYPVGERNPVGGGGQESRRNGAVMAYMAFRETWSGVDGKNPMGVDDGANAAADKAANRVAKKQVAKKQAGLLMETKRTIKSKRR